MNNPKINLLLVEDDKDFRKALSARLTKNDIDITSASTGEEALELMNKNHFDAVVLDIKMPGMSGIEFLAKVREFNSALPVIILTGYASLESAKEAVRLSASDYLLKPLESINDLLDPVYKAVNSYRLSRKNSQLLDSLKETRIQLAQAEKMEAIGRLASGVAHEVKNPLAVIMQGVNYLEKYFPDEKDDKAEILRMIKDNVKRADYIIRALLDFSKARELEIKQECINSILDGSLLLIRHRPEFKVINIIKELGINLPKALVDKSKIEQVFINILINAVQSMPAGGKITIRSYLKKINMPGNKAGRRAEDYFAVGEEAVVVDIEDEGSGISEENLKKVFNPFFTTKGREGTGLGLAVVRNIIDMHKGLIEIESPPRPQGQGTKVTITLKIV